GLAVRGNAEATRILGGDAVRAVQLSPGEVRPADVVVMAIGVRPRTALAQDARLSVNRGIVVNDFLTTSFPGIYAAGDAAEWQGKVYGTVSAAREQALVAAQNMVEPGSVRYRGTASAQRLKVAGIELLVLGDSQPQGGRWPEERVRREDRYVKLVLDEERRLLGAIVLGMPEIMREVEELFRERRAVPEAFLSLV
ncbi:MAG: FAD-dependent oxidoreductase, partial [Candidatus Bipolaricaulaceae bacterium]